MLTAWGVLLLAPAARAAGDDAESAGGDVPVAPLTAVDFKGWTNACLLHNRACEVVVVPAIGRIARFTPLGGTNCFHLAPALLGRRADDPALRRGWNNFGGDWAYPLAQERWSVLTEAGLRPTRYLDGPPWSGQAWRAADGAEICRMTRSYGPPLKGRFSRTVRVSGVTAALRVDQRFERTGASDVPVLLWNVSQITRPRRIVLPVDSDTAFEKGYRSLGFKDPRWGTVTRLPDAVVYHVDVGRDHRIGTDSQRGWVAAEGDGRIVLERNRPAAAPGARAPSGCTAAAYGSSNGDYAEIELLGEERKLDKGEALENTIWIECYPTFGELSDAELVARIRLLVGETETPAPPAER